MKKHAFTLAEVLITLTIIGVIAALTIPNLMKKYDKHVHEVRFKNAYSYFFNTIRTKMSEYGCSDIACVLDNNNISNSRTEDDYIAIMKLFFNNVERPKTYSKDWYGWWNQGNIKNLYGGTTPANVGAGALPMLLDKKIGIALINGYTKISKGECTYSSTSSCIQTYIYTDVPQKPTFGKNVFVLNVSGKGTFMPNRPENWNWYTKDFIVGELYKINPKYGGSGIYGAETAAVYLARNGWKMDYLK